MMLVKDYTSIEYFGHVYNYINVTQENVRIQYLNARLAINVLKNIILFIFSYMTWKDVQVAFDHHDSLGMWFLSAFLYLF